ncbi:zinc finger BED domain-containing protein 5-like [Pagrus major]|uniref:zinc finger BED domain-containing protein 5-like n=1 Tax=Pagrus major TaxID=143350 RepID=UPI003CC8DD2A
MGEAAAAKLDAIPMSDNTIQHRTSDMAADVKEQVLDAIRESPFFSIQLDESTDVANCAQLMVYVRFIKELSAQEEFLFCHPLPALATKRMPKELRAVLDEAVKIVNLIKSHAMNARLFSILCNKMGAHFHQLLLHSEIRWLSRGKVLTRLCDLHEEVLLFLAEIDSPLVKHMEDAKWVAMLAYLSDIFDRINTLNTSLQGKECHVFLAHDQVSAFRKKLDLWCARVERGSVEMFPTLEDVVEKTGLQLDCVRQVVIAHLKGLREQFGDYFGEETLANQWVRNPFSFPVTPRDGLTLQEEEALVELNSNMDLKQKMSEVSLAHFWLSVETKFPHLTKKAVKVFIPFTSTYLCECGFSALTMIKSKYQSRLRVEDDLRLFPFYSASPHQPPVRIKDTDSLFPLK